MTQRGTMRSGTALVAGLIGAVVLVAVVVFALAQRDETGQGPDPTVTTTQSPSPEVTASTSPPAGSPETTTSAEPSPATGWSVMLDEGQDGRVNRLSDVAVLDDWVIAVGESVHAEIIHVGPYERSALVWTSADGGVTWTDRSADPAFADATVRWVEVVDDQAYLIGATGMNDSSLGSAFRVWRSADGEVWESVELEPFADDAWTATAVAGGPRGWVMTGEMTLSQDPLERERQVWYTADWSSWELTRSSLAPDADTPLDGQEWYHDVGAGPEGFVVVAGLDYVGETRSRLLASSDGRTWSEAPAEPHFGTNVQVRQVAPIGPDWVATGVDQSVAALPVWTSPDGLAWERATEIDDPQARENFGVGLALGVADGRLFLSAHLIGLETELEAGVWSSADGVAWEPVELGAGASVSEAVRVDDAWLLVGWVGGQESNATIWRSTAP